MQPTFTVFAGPNGAGKSTIILAPEFADRRTNLLEADAIAKRMDPAVPVRAAVAAGREVILRTREFLASGESFAMETTFSGSRNAATMREAQRSGFLVELVYVGVDTPELSIERVRQRVAWGGHDVPDEDVRRRYFRSLANLASAFPIVDRVIVYDNSKDAPRRVLEAAKGVVYWRGTQYPDWVSSLFEPAPRSL